MRLWTLTAAGNNAANANHNRAPSCVWIFFHLKDSTISASEKEESEATAGAPGTSRLSRPRDRDSLDLVLVTRRVSSSSFGPRSHLDHNGSGRTLTLREKMLYIITVWSLSVELWV